VRSQQEAEEAMAAIQRDQAARALAASGAFADLQGAQAQGPPAPTALDALPQFFSNIASIASQRPEFAERRERSTAAQRAELLSRRGENLRSLENRYTQLAKQAQEIDPVKALEYEEKVGKLHKEQEKLLEMQRQSATTERAREAATAEMEKEKFKQASQTERTKILAGARTQAAKIRASSRGATTKPPTGVERRALSFYIRANDAKTELSTKDPTGLSMEDRIAKQNWIGAFQGKFAPNIAKSAIQRQYQQAKEAWYTAYLRKDSGATITPVEWETANKTYFVQPGDDDKTIAQKQRARDAVMKGLKQESGNAFKEYYEGPEPTAPAEDIDPAYQEILSKIEALEAGGP
jgi:hypothetical protein